MTSRRLAAGAALLTVLLAPSCAQDSPEVLARAQRFDEGRAWLHLEELVRLGPAANGLPGHQRVGDYLRRRLRESGAHVRDTRFQHTRSGETAPRDLVNISASYGPPDAKTWILLGTHYDTRLWAEKDAVPERRDEPIQGANDGCSGTAVLLEVALVLGEHPPEIGVEIVFFDGEDFGRPEHIDTDYFLGSRHMVRHLRELHPEGPPAAVVVLDMVGDSDLSFHRDAGAERSFRWLNDRLWRTAREMGEPAFGDRSPRAVTDDHTAFAEAGIPATLLIDFDYPYWHTSQDTLDKCSKKSLGATGRVLLGALVDRPL